MKTKFTKKFMRENCGCYKEEELNNCSFMKLMTITLADIINSEIPIKDKFWFVCRKAATMDETQAIAIACARTVLPIYESRHPDDVRVRNCIEAAEKYLRKEISIDELINARIAADAADAAPEIKINLLKVLTDLI